MGSLLESLYLGRRHHLGKILDGLQYEYLHMWNTLTKTGPGQSTRNKGSNYLPSNAESGGPRMVACQWKGSSPTGPALYEGIIWLIKILIYPSELLWFAHMTNVKFHKNSPLVTCIELVDHSWCPSTPCWSSSEPSSSSSLSLLTIHFYNFCYFYFQELEQN